MSRKKTQNRTNIILERISSYYHLVNDEAIAAFYGVSESTVSSWRTRNVINIRLIKAKCNDDNLANWFINGIESPKREPHIVAEPQAPYMPCQLRRITDRPETKIPEILEKTRYILESHTTHRIALTTAVEACHYAVKCEEKIKEQDERIKELEEELKLPGETKPPAATG